MSRLRTLLGSRPDPVEVRIPVGLLEAQRSGPAPLAPGADPDRTRLDVAFVVPSFRKVSGGHTTIANLVRALEARGHACSLWIVDDDARSPAAPTRTGDGRAAERFHAYFGPTRGPVHEGLADWRGADVVVATAWQTVPSALLLTNAQARAYLVQDHEPEFYATSSERHWAAWTYRQGLHCLVASPWLAQVVGTHYGASATVFDIGVDHALYRPREVERRADRVLFYARAVTPRRGVPLGLLALEELHRRRPDVEIVLFGEDRPVRTAFPHVDLGVRSRPELADAYAAATVGLCLSLTNPSLIPNEMLACGLPCVDVASDSALASYGEDPPIALPALDPVAIADAIEQLLDDPALRRARAEAGIARVAAFTWERTAAQVEAGLRAALRGA